MIKRAYADVGTALSPEQFRESSAAGALIVLSVECVGKLHPSERGPADKAASSWIKDTQRIAQKLKPATMEGILSGAIGLGMLTGDDLGCSQEKRPTRSAQF